MRIAILIIVGFFLAMPAAPVAAAVCAVPGTHNSIQAAEDDPGCSDIQISNQTYSELLAIDRGLSLSGPDGGSAQINGQVDVTGPTTLTALQNFSIDSSCSGGGLRVSGGAQVTGIGLRVAFNSTTPCSAEVIFRDGFEE